MPEDRRLKAGAESVKKPFFLFEYNLSCENVPFPIHSLQHGVRADLIQFLSFLLPSRFCAWVVGKVLPRLTGAGQIARVGTESAAVGLSRWLSGRGTVQNLIKTCQHPGVGAPSCAPVISSEGSQDGDGLHPVRRDDRPFHLEAVGKLRRLVVVRIRWMFVQVRRKASGLLIRFEWKSIVSEQLQ